MVYPQPERPGVRETPRQSDSKTARRVWTQEESTCHRSCSASRRSWTRRTRENETRTNGSHRARNKPGNRLQRCRKHRDSAADHARHGHRSKGERRRTLHRGAEEHLGVEGGRGPDAGARARNSRNQHHVGKPDRPARTRMGTCDPARPRARGRGQTCWRTRIESRTGDEPSQERIQTLCRVGRNGWTVSE